MFTHCVDCTGSGLQRWFSQHLLDVLGSKPADRHLAKCARIRLRVSLRALSGVGADSRSADAHPVSDTAAEAADNNSPAAWYSWFTVLRKFSPRLSSSRDNSCTRDTSAESSGTCRKQSGSVRTEVVATNASRRSPLQPAAGLIDKQVPFLAGFEHHGGPESDLIASD